MALSDLRQMLCLALDVPSLDMAKSVLKQTAWGHSTVKVGHALAHSAGGLGRLAKALKPFKMELMWDCKLHDSPETMARDAMFAAECGVSIITVQASSSSGPDALSAVVKAAPGLKVLAVTVLTTMDDVDVRAIYHVPLEHKVWEFARTAKESKAAGIICAATDIPALRKRDDGMRHYFTATPGIRPDGKLAKDDQKRMATPRKALTNGSDMLIIGRPVWAAKDPAKSLNAIVAELMDAQGGNDAVTA